MHAISQRNVAELSARHVMLSGTPRSIWLERSGQILREYAQDDRGEHLVIARSRRGFTLIELMLAMAISAALAAALYLAMSTAFRAKRTAENAAFPATAGAIAMDLITHDLDSALPPPPSTDTTTTYLSGPFVGTHQGSGDYGNDDLLFRMIDHDDPPDANDPLSEGIRQVEFLISTDSTPPALIRRVTRNLLGTGQQQTTDEVLCRNVRGFTCKYFDGTDWQTDWDSTQLGDVLPVAVQVEIDIDDPRATVRPGERTPVRPITRVVPLACAKPAPTDANQ